ncbi:MAG TPA: thioredoxin domain-containing protein, partial [Solirubrobacteraceae bacterium]|nr:thioredoxin domain-containing protein [Solirubrobacteraceae bacterium]
KDLDDSPIPSGGSAAAFGLLRLARLTGKHAYEERALGVLRVRAPIVGRHPHGFGHVLQALDFHLSPVREVAIVGNGAAGEELVRVVRGDYRPHVVLAGGTGGDEDEVPLLEGRTPVGGRAAAYVCERFSCQAPVTDAGELAAALR